MENSSLLYVLKHSIKALELVVPLEYSEYYLWHQVQTIASNIPAFANTANVTFQSGSAPGQSGTTLAVSILAGVALSAGDYYVFELPSSIRPDFTLTCPNGISLCLSFPDANWVVYQLSSALGAGSSETGDIKTVTVPGSLNPNGYSFFAYAWRSNVFTNIVNYGVGSSSYSTLTGNIGSKVLTVDSNQLVLNRLGTEFYLEFKTSADIPANGTIEVRFPAGFTPRPNCKNSPSMGSKLTSSTGRVACSVQGTSWVITNIDLTLAGTNIRLYGLADLPGVSGGYGLSVYTYSNVDSNIVANGQRIEAATTGFTFTITNINTLSLDEKPTIKTNENAIATTNSYHPLVFDFTLSKTAVTTTSTIQLRLNGATTAFQGTRTTGEANICYFRNLDTSAITACSVTTATANSVLTFTLTPLVALNVGTNYRAVISTAFATNGIDGIIYPQAASVYKAALVVTSGANVESDITFLEIVPSKFSTLVVKNYVISASELDLIDISFTVASSISTTQRIVVEIPTVFNNTAMFAEDLGLGYSDGQSIDCDMVSSVPAALTSNYPFIT